MNDKYKNDHSPGLLDKSISLRDVIHGSFGVIRWIISVIVGLLLFLVIPTIFINWGGIQSGNRYDFFNGPLEPGKYEITISGSEGLENVIGFDGIYLESNEDDCLLLRPSHARLNLNEETTVIVRGKCTQPLQVHIKITDILGKIIFHFSDFNLTWQYEYWGRQG